MPVDRFPLLVEVVTGDVHAPAGASTSCASTCRPPAAARPAPGRGPAPGDRVRVAWARGDEYARVAPEWVPANRDARRRRGRSAAGRSASASTSQSDLDAARVRALARRLGPRGRPGLTRICSLRVQGGWRRPRSSGRRHRRALAQGASSAASVSRRTSSPSARSAGVASSSGWCETPVVERTKSMPAGTPAAASTPASWPANDGRSTAARRRGGGGVERRADAGVEVDAGVVGERGQRHAGAAAAIAATSASRRPACRRAHVERAA